MHKKRYPSVGNEKTRSKCADGTTAATQRRRRRSRLHRSRMADVNRQRTSAALTSGTVTESPTALDRRQRRRRLHPLSA